MKRPYSLQAKDITLNFVKDKYGPNERQDLGKPIMIDHMIIFDQSDYITSFQATSISIWRLIWLNCSTGITNNFLFISWERVNHV